MQETKRYLRDFASAQSKRCLVWYGMRANESHNRKAKYSGLSPDDMLDMNEVFPSTYPKYLAKLGVFMQLPIVNYSSSEVFDLLAGEHNPLYDQGFDRVGCFPCLASGDKWKVKAFTFDEFGRTQREKVEKVEKEIGKSIFTSKALAGSGCMVCSI